MWHCGSEVYFFDSLTCLLEFCWSIRIWCTFPWCNKSHSLIATKLLFRFYLFLSFVWDFNSWVVDYLSTKGKIYKHQSTKYNTIMTTKWVEIVTYHDTALLTANWATFRCWFWWAFNTFMSACGRSTISHSCLIFVIMFRNKKINKFRRLVFQYRGINPTCSNSVCSSFTIIMIFTLEYLSQTF